MQYQQTMQGLGDMYNLPVAMMPQAMDLLGQQQRADAMTEQNQGRQLAYDTAEDPLKLQRTSLENQGLQEGLPGITARSNIDVRRNKMGDATYDSEVAAAIAKHGADKVASHAAEAGSMAERISQLAEEAAYSPVGAGMRTKKAFESMGHGDLWRPDWDNKNPEELAATLRDMGGTLQATSTKYRTAAELAKAKGDYAVTVGAGHDAASIQRAQIEAAGRLAAKRKPEETMSVYEARIRREAGDGNEHALRELGTLELNKQQKAAAGAGATAAGKASTDAQGVPSQATQAKVDTAAATYGVPKAAVQFLLDNPHLKADFETKYKLAPGTADKILLGK